MVRSSEAALSDSLEMLIPKLSFARAFISGIFFFHLLPCSVHVWKQSIKLTPICSELTLTAWFLLVKMIVAANFLLNTYQVSGTSFSSLHSLEKELGAHLACWLPGLHSVPCTRYFAGYGKQSLRKS